MHSGSFASLPGLRLPSDTRPGSAPWFTGSFAFASIVQVWDASSILGRAAISELNIIGSCPPVENFLPLPYLTDTR